MSDALENREIKGVSLRTVRWVVGSTVLICMSIAGSYYGIQARLSQLDSRDAMQTYRIQKIETTTNSLQVQINTNTIEIQKLKENFKDEQRH